MPSCPAGSHSAATPLMMHVWIVDNACGHRFGGIGVDGLHCDVGMHEGGDHGHDPGDSQNPGGTHDDGHDMMPVAPPASPVTGDPNFTG